MKRTSYLATAVFLVQATAGSAIFLSGSGCGDSDDNPPAMNPPGNPPGQTTTTTYYHDIKPLMDRYCTTCHRDGDIAPFALTDYSGVNTHAPMIKTAVESGTMPPWLPSDAGLSLRYNRELRPQDKQLLLDWLAAGAPAGDPATPPRTDIPPAEQESPPRADLVLKAPQPYMPDMTMTDDYHCVVFDPKNDHDRFLLAGQVNPDNRAIAHHMALYLIPPAQAAQVKALDTGSGYTCFGGAAKNVQSGLLLGWAPGGTSMRTPTGTAFRIPTGSVLVMQMHYNVVAANGKPDQTSVVLELGDTPPDHELVSMFIGKFNLAIKAGDANWKESATTSVGTLAMRSGLPATGDVVAYGAFPHMHLLGKRTAVTLAGGPTLIEIPKWDFHWQNAYSFTTPMTLHATDMMQIECDYDNSFANQPVVDGQKQMPRDVHWGESTLDEMCITVLTVSAAK